MTYSGDLTKVAVTGQMSGHQRNGLGISEDKKRSRRQQVALNSLSLPGLHIILQNVDIPLQKNSIV